MGSVRFRLSAPSDPRAVLLKHRGDTVYLHASPTDGPEQLDALQALEKHLPLLMRSLQKHYPYSADSDDVGQEFCLAVLNARRVFDSSRNARLSTFAYTVVKNTMVDLGYSESGRQRSSPDCTLHTESSLVVDEESEDALSLFEQLGGVALDHGCQQVEFADVRKFIAGLPPRQREVAVLVYWHEYTQAEAARHLGISRSAVNELLQKIHEKGKEVLSAYDPSR